jgi:protein TonB
MGHSATVEPPVVKASPAETRTPAKKRPPELRLTGLIESHQRSIVAARGSTLTVSLVLHTALAAAVILIPLLFFEDFLPEPNEAVRAFFVQPTAVIPPPPPPPPAPPAAAARVTRPAPPKPVETSSFVAPIEIPEQLQQEQLQLDIGGVEGGVAGGVEGGVPGGVLGGIVGGLPQTKEAPPAPVVRVGGNIVAPRKIRDVPPEYPTLALQARLSGLVILEAHVDTRGQVKSVKLLRGAPLFDDAAIAAVKQWRYQPLLLNGQPTEFLLTVTVMFNLAQQTPQG